MRDFLLFTLYAPLAALGEVAVGERRVSAARPARSAILGLLAAALGIERRDEAAHAALQEGYGVAVRVETEGALLQDYHTAQVPPAKKGRRWPTRRAELAEPRLETILSLREYRADARHTVALWTADDPPQPLAVLAEALRRPRFTLYLGRKACPLGLPAAPRIVAAADPGRGLRDLRSRHARGGAGVARASASSHRTNGPLVCRRRCRRLARPGPPACAGSSAGATPSSAAAAGSSGCGTSWSRCLLGPGEHAVMTRLLAEPRPAQARRVRRGPRPDPSAGRPGRPGGSHPPPALDAVRGQPRAPARLSLARGEPGRASPRTRVVPGPLRAPAGGPPRPVRAGRAKPFEPALAPGDRLGFSLRANPVVTRADPRTGRPRRHDVVMDRLHALPKGARADAPTRGDARRPGVHGWPTRAPVTASGCR